MNADSDLTQYYKHQVELLKTLYQQRLEDVVLTIKQAAQQSKDEVSSNQVEILKQSLFSEREAAMQRIIEQFAQKKAECVQLAAEVQKLANQLQERNQAHEKLKKYYNSEHSELKQLRHKSQEDIMSPEQIVKVKMQEAKIKRIEEENSSLREKVVKYQQENKILADRQLPVNTVLKETHDQEISDQKQKLVMEFNNQLKMVEQQHQFALQQERFETEKQLSKQKVSFDKRLLEEQTKMHDLQLQINLSDQRKSVDDQQNNQLMDLSKKVKQLEFERNQLQETNKHQEQQLRQIGQKILLIGQGKQLQTAKVNMVCKQLLEFKQQLRTLREQIQMKPIINLQVQQYVAQQLQRFLNQGQLKNQLTQEIFQLVLSREQELKTGIQRQLRELDASVAEWK